MKYRLTVEETIKYMHEVVIETEDDIDEVCNEIENTVSYAMDISYGGNNYRCVDFIEDESGDFGNVEIIDAEEIDDEE